MSNHDSNPENKLTASMERFRQEMERWVDVVRSSGSRAWETFRSRAQDAGWVPAIDLVEQGDHFFVRVDVPGARPDQVEVTLTGNMLTVSGKIEADAAEQSTPEPVTHLQERPQGAFSRALPLPMAVDPEVVEAQLKQGVLTVTLTKAARSRPHTIPVRSADEPATSNAT